jgi:hypothetical protein
MKKSIKTTLMVMLAASALTVSGQVFDFPVDSAHTTTPQTIPDASDGNTYIGTVSGFADNSFPGGYYIKVHLDIEGNPIAKNGDYYATLTDVSTGNKAVLLNRVGKGSTDFPNGYADNGMNVILQDLIGGVAAPDIHTYRVGVDPSAYLQPLTGTFAPDARSADPTKVTFDRNDAINNPLLKLANISTGKANPNGDYALFIQDNVQGGVGKLVDWGMEFVAVPEPQAYALVAGLALMGFGLYRRYSVKVA